ncbi:hypothetical protein Tco_0998269 [Tanacetum coccineum]
MFVKCLSLQKSNSLDYEKHSQKFTTCAKMTISDYQTQLNYCLNNLEMVINARTFIEKELQIKQQNVIKRTNDINCSHEKYKTEGQWSNNELFENVFDHNNEVEKTNEDIKALKEANVLLTKDLKMYQERLSIFGNKPETVLKRDYNELQTQLFNYYKKEKHELENQILRKNIDIASICQTRDSLKANIKHHEDKYLNEILELRAKNKDLENIVCKMGRSTKTLWLLTNEQNAFWDNLRKSGLGYNGPYVLSQAYAKIHKLYRAYELRDENEQLHVFDCEDTLEYTDKIRLKMNEFQKDEKVKEL